MCCHSSNVQENYHVFNVVFANSMIYTAIHKTSCRTCPISSATLTYMKLLGLKVSGAMGDFVPFFRVTRGLHINTKYVHLELFHMASCFKCKVHLLVTCFTRNMHGKLQLGWRYTPVCQTCSPRTSPQWELHLVWVTTIQKYCFYT